MYSYRYRRRFTTLYSILNIKCQCMCLKHYPNNSSGSPQWPRHVSDFLCTYTKSSHNISFSIIIAKPRLMGRLDYLLDVMKLSKEDILSWPGVLRCRELRLRERHSLLKHLNRAQYSPTEFGYISLKDLCSNSDEHFREHVAKITPEDYLNYMKTL